MHWPKAADLRRGHRLDERDRHKTLCRKVIELHRVGLLQQLDDCAQIRQIAFDEMEIETILDTQLINPQEVDRSSTPIGTINRVTLPNSS